MKFPVCVELEKERGVGMKKGTLFSSVFHLNTWMCLCTPQGSLAEHFVLNSVVLSLGVYLFLFFFLQKLSLAVGMWSIYLCGPLILESTYVFCLSSYVNQM